VPNDATSGRPSVLSWCMAKRTPITDEERIRLFLHFCLELEQHPFFVWIQRNRRASLNAMFREDATDVVELSFDETHLESFLCRLRQFLSPKEAFHITNMKSSVEAVLGTDQQLDEFALAVKRALDKAVPRGPMEAYKGNGAPVAEGRTALELLEAALYTGAIHSERLAEDAPDASTSGWIDAHPIAKGHLRVVLAAISPAVAQNVFSLRMQIQRRSESAVSASWSCGELDELNARVREWRARQPA